MDNLLQYASALDGVLFSINNLAYSVVLPQFTVTRSTVTLLYDTV